jgi:hypothetical protein
LDVPVPCDYTKRLRGYGVEGGMEKVEFDVNEG